MLEWITSRLRDAYADKVRQSIKTTPDHVAVIQDGNRRYAREHGLDPADGHAHGAETTEDLLHWCNTLDISEVTLYTFSTENFTRPDDELEQLFDLICEKLYSFADADLVHEQNVRINGLGDIQQLPADVVEAVKYAEQRTQQYDSLKLNIAIAYGGRNELLQATQAIAKAVEAGTIDPDEITAETVESQLYQEPIQPVDLVVRTGGNERTSNFLPWYANGNEAIAYFSASYWPAFSRVDFYKAIRTYEAREKSWQETRIQRATVLLNALARRESQEHQAAVTRVRDKLADSGAAADTQTLADSTEVETLLSHADD